MRRWAIETYQVYLQIICCFKVKILIIEDEVELAKSIESYLSTEGYLCEYAADFMTAMDRVSRFEYSCILLDLMLPGGSGIKILEYLKSENKQDGVIVISAKNSVDDKIDALMFGADDYLAKPIHLSELSARVFSVIRRKSLHNSNVITFNEITIDILSKVVKVRDNQVHLTRSEYNLLVYFISNKGKNISKSAIAEYISGDMAEMLASYDFIYSHVKNLKKKLQQAGSENYLTTIYGSGYRWEL